MGIWGAITDREGQDKLGAAYQVILHCSEGQYLVFKGVILEEYGVALRFLEFAIDFVLASCRLHFCQHY